MGTQRHRLGRGLVCRLVHRSCLTLNLLLVPAVVIGVFSGSWLIRRLPQQWFEWIMLASALLAAVRLLFW